MDTIQTLLTEIEKFDLVLPEFQREYVWSKEQGKQLLVSLYKGYPTGSLLFWKTDRPPKIKHDAVPQDKIGTVNVLLDGQQRLMTLYLLLRDGIPPYYVEEDIDNDPRDLYFNLRDGTFQYYQVSKMGDDPAWVSVVECFADGEVNPVDIANQLGSDGTQDTSMASQFFKHLNRLQSIQSRTYPIQLVPEEAGIDDAIEVFDRVNSLGTKLSDAQLALAHICGKWPEARQVMKEKIAELAKSSFEFDLTFMVRALTAVSKRTAQLESIHEEPKDSLQDGWELLEAVLDYMVTILPAHAHIHSTGDLNTNNVFVPLLAYLAEHDGKFSTGDEMHRAIHWLYAAHTWRRYTSQVTTRMDHDLSHIHRKEDPFDSLIEAIIDQRGRIEVKPADFEGRGTRHPLYRMAHIAAKGQGALDWFNGVKLGNTVGGKYDFQSHHIFPRSLLYGEGEYSQDNHLHKKLVNEIANRAFLTAEANVSLGNTPPSEYLAEIADKYPGALEKQFVPTEPHLWELENYEQFLEVRRKLMADAINEFMRQTVSEHEAEAPQAIEELIAAGESQSLEYKASMRWDLWREQVNKDLEHTIAKTIAGFLNTYGGTLVIGVSDDLEVLGIEQDMQTLPDGDLDSYEQKLVQLVKDYIGPQYSGFIRPRFEHADGKQVCVVEVDPSPNPTYVEYQGDKQFYIRAGNSTRPLDAEQTHEYIGMHWES